MLRRVIVLMMLLKAVCAFGAPLPPRMIIDAPYELQPVARKIASVDPARIRTVMDLVGVETSGAPIVVVIAPESSETARSTPSWIAGWAVADRSLIVLFPARANSYPDDGVEDLLRHELAHVFVGRASGGRPVPRWFNEGVAMSAGRSWGLEDQTRAAVEMATGERSSLANLDRLFVYDESAAARAYALSGSFVRDLLQRKGRDVVSRILHFVASGDSFETAFRRATGETLEGAESDYWSRQTVWTRWIPTITSVVTLWVIVTLLALWAIRVRHGRDAKRRAQWDAEESEAVRRALEEWDDDEVQ